MSTAEKLPSVATGSRNSARQRPMPAAGDDTMPSLRWPEGTIPGWWRSSVSMATFMEVLDTSIANVALPHIAGSLAASIDESTWVLTSYLVANAIILPISGWLATRDRPQRFYMGCVALFTVSSVLCGFAPSLTWLIFFRVLQGLGAAGCRPANSRSWPIRSRPENAGMAFALYGVAVVVAPAVGPTLGGWITDNYSWHWIFFINLPVGLRLAGRSATWCWSSRRPKRSIAANFWPEGCGSTTLASAWWPSAWAPCRSCSTRAARRLVRLELHRHADDHLGRDAQLLVIWELIRDEPIVDLPLLSNRGFVASSC